MKNDCSCKTISPYYCRRKPESDRVSRHRRKKNGYCFEHTDFCSDLYEGNIETHPAFKNIVERLNTFNKINRYIRASLFYSYFLKRDGFYHNSRKLCDACYKRHPNISRMKLVILVSWLYRWSHQKVDHTKDSFTDHMYFDSSEDTDDADPGSGDESEEENPKQFTSENIPVTKHGKKLAKQLEINMFFWPEILPKPLTDDGIDEDDDDDDEY